MLYGSAESLRSEPNGRVSGTLSPWLEGRSSQAFPILPAALGRPPLFVSIMTFSNLPPAIGDALAARGYSAPTDVQAAVLAPEAAGRDLVVSAKTGSGKTVAFGLALAADLLDCFSAPTQAPVALVIAPTRELALQVSRELGWLYSGAGARIATCVGGMDASKERRALRGGVHVVVGTPGRLRDHLERGALDLSQMKAVVLDEADEMLDMGFREDLEEILDATPAERRTLLFSATMPKPIVGLAKRYQRDSLRISTAGDDRGHGDIAFQAVTVSPAEIEAAAVNLLRYHEAETAILFCATRDNVRRLHATLQERGFGVVALSGEHSQSERNQALQALRDRRARVCVATDVAARGIDLPSLSLVIHVEIPRDAETLQHRSGRTGRAGKKGTAVVIVPYPRRKRVESMLRGAKIKADWIDAPTPEAIRAQDRERLIATLLQPVECDEEDRELARRLLEERSPEDIAAALVRAHRSAMPQPEELLENTPEARKAAQKERHRPGFDDVVWFRMDAGRRDNADPRWILPLLCRRGHITRNEVGAIRIGANETHFQIPRAIAAKFGEALTRTMPEKDDRDAVRIEPSDGPREAARGNRNAKPGKPPHRGRKDNSSRSKPHARAKDKGRGRKDHKA
jgi:ATP-dependent RNA helicase DeaD